MAASADLFEMLFPVASDKLDRIIITLRAIMANLSALQAAVEAENTVIDSAITLLNGLAEALRAAATDPAAVQALADEVGAKSAALAAAVQANTPAV